MIQEQGVDRRFLDISQLSTATDIKVALVSSATQAFRKSDNKPYLQFTLTDVNGFKISGMFWNVTNLPEINKVDFSSIVNHLVSIHYTPSIDLSYLNIEMINELPADIDEGDALASNFLRKLTNLAAHQKSLEGTLALAFEKDPRFVALSQTIAESSMLKVMANSRHLDICDGAFGGRLSLVSSVVGLLVSSVYLFDLNPVERRTLYASAVLYEYLCARYEPINKFDNRLWKMEALGELSDILEPINPELTPEIANTLSSTVIELLGLADVYSKSGAILQHLRETCIKLSKLSYIIANQTGNTPITYDGVLFTK